MIYKYRKKETKKESKKLSAVSPGFSGMIFTAATSWMMKSEIASFFQGGEDSE